jgi:hypothetical protein
MERKVLEETVQLLIRLNSKLDLWAPYQSMEYYELEHINKFLRSPRDRFASI